MHHSPLAVSSLHDRNASIKALLPRPKGPGSTPDWPPPPLLNQSIGLHRAGAPAFGKVFHPTPNRGRSRPPQPREPTGSGSCGPSDGISCSSSSLLSPPSASRHGAAWRGVRIHLRPGCGHSPSSPSRLHAAAATKTRTKPNQPNEQKAPTREELLAAWQHWLPRT